MNPLGEHTLEDWVAYVRFSDGKVKRYGSTPHTPEADVLPMIMRMLPEEIRSQVVDFKQCRRSEAKKMAFYDKVQA
jgi:hypothetical protein